MLKHLRGRLVFAVCVRRGSLHEMQTCSIAFHLQPWTRRGMFLNLKERLLNSLSLSISPLALSPADYPPAQTDHLKSCIVKNPSQSSYFHAANSMFHKYFLHPEMLPSHSTAGKRFHSSANLHKNIKFTKTKDLAQEDSDWGRESNISRENLIEDKVNRDLVEQIDLPGEESDLGREVSVTALVEMLASRIAEQGRKSELPSNQQLQQQVAHLLQNGFSPSLVLHLLSRQPDLAASQRWHGLLHAMLLHGLTPRRLTHMLVNTENLSQVSVGQFTSMVQCLRGVGMSDTELLRLLFLCPSVLGLPLRTVASRVVWLRDLFKTKDVLRLLCSCPSLLFEDMAVVQEKFDYVFYRMGVSQRQMMHSHLFTYDLSHLQTRHAFVERAGFFSSSRRREGERSANPRLDHVIDSTDKAFARRFGNMGSEDYAAFKALFQMEMAELRRREAEGGSSDDDDEDKEK